MFQDSISSCTYHHSLPTLVLSIPLAHSLHPLLEILFDDLGFKSLPPPLPSMSICTVCTYIPTSLTCHRTILIPPLLPLCSRSIDRSTRMMTSASETPNDRRPSSIDRPVRLRAHSSLGSLLLCTHHHLSLSLEAGGVPLSLHRRPSSRSPNWTILTARSIYRSLSSNDFPASSSTSVSPPLLSLSPLVRAPLRSRALLLLLLLEHTSPLHPVCRVPHHDPSP